MEVLYIFGAIFMLYWLYKAFKKIDYKYKYPISSDTLPDRILSPGDKVYFDKLKTEFIGIDTNHGAILYVFRSENSVTPDLFYNRKYIKDNITTIHGDYGVKWERPSYFLS